MLLLRTAAQDDYFLAHLSGLVAVDAWDKGLGALEAALAEVPFDRLVIDLTGLVGWLGVPERTQVGALMAKHLKRMKKVALFIQSEKIAGVVEAEARRQGLDLKLFPSQEPAVAWVLS